MFSCRVGTFFGSWQISFYTITSVFHPSFWQNPFLVFILFGKSLLFSQRCSRGDRNLPLGGGHPKGLEPFGRLPFHSSFSGDFFRPNPPTEPCIRRGLPRPLWTPLGPILPRGFPPLDCPCLGTRRRLGDQDFPGRPGLRSWLAPFRVIPPLFLPPFGLFFASSSDSKTQMFDLLSFPTDHI